MAYNFLFLPVVLLLAHPLLFCWQPVESFSLSADDHPQRQRQRPSSFQHHGARFSPVARHVGDASTTTSTRLFFFKFPNLSLSLPSSEEKEGVSKGRPQQERDRLKRELLQACRLATKNDSKAQQQQRELIEDLMEQLAQVNPIPASASSPKLQKKWKLVWTTEKEINFFLDWNFSQDIFQTIRTIMTEQSEDNQQNEEEGSSLSFTKSIIENAIPFVKGGGGFYVTGRLSIPDPTSIRTEFQFETATLDLGKRWGTYNFPPIGAGWFDTLYLDDELRVDVNSRNDILICVPAESSSGSDSGGIKTTTASTSTATESKKNTPFWKLGGPFGSFSKQPIQARTALSSTARAVDVVGQDITINNNIDNNDSSSTTSMPVQDQKNEKKTLVRYRGRVAYDGSGFSGFQIQVGRKNTRTIQAALEEVLQTRFNRSSIRVVGAGRTDTGTVG